jgi:hypothetical protein
MQLLIEPAKEEPLVELHARVTFATQPRARTHTHTRPSTPR